MNTVSRKRVPRDGRNGRHRPVRWFSLLMGVAVLSVSGAVMADVILVYLATNQINSANGDFQFQDGTNYLAANGVGVISNVCQGTTTPCNGAVPGTGGLQITTTLTGIPFVSVNMYDVTEFAMSTATTAAGTVTISSTLGAYGSGAAITCAVAFVSLGLPTPPTSLSGSVCTANVPTAAAPNSVCNGAYTAGVETVNLLTGTTGGTVISCGFTGVTQPTGVILYVSYAVILAGSITTTTGLAPINVQVT